MISRLVCFWLLLAAQYGLAMDYGDSLEVRSNPSLDLGNLYVWHSTSDQKLFLVLTLGPTVSTTPTSVFEQRGRYRLHIDTDNDLTEDIAIDFYFGGGNEYAATTGPESIRGPVGTVTKAEHWQAFAGIIGDPAFGDYAALNQFFVAKYPCAPNATAGLRCGGQAATGQPTNAFQGQNTGMMGVTLSSAKFGINPNAKINVWASSWVAP